MKESGTRREIHISIYQWQMQINQGTLPASILSGGTVREKKTDRQTVCPTEECHRVERRVSE